LRSAIGRDIVEPLAASDRRGVDDLAAGTLRDHLARGLLHADQAAKTIHTHDEIPVFFGHVQKVHRPVDAGIVELDIDLSEDGYGVRNQRTDLHAVGHIDRGVRHLAAGSLGGGKVGCCNLSDLVAIDIGKTDIGSLAQKRLADGSANAARGSGDDAGTPGQPAHAHLPITWQIGQDRSGRGVAASGEEIPRGSEDRLGEIGHVVLGDLRRVEVVEERHFLAIQHIERGFQRRLGVVDGDW
jgi:hypothetical protein